MGKIPRDLYHVSLSASTEWVRRGHSITLQWKAIGVEATVASVHLATGFEDETRMIESVTAQGVREVIFEQVGLFTFCLTVTFGDGAKGKQEVSIVVDE